MNAGRSSNKSLALVTIVSGILASCTSALSYHPAKGRDFKGTGYSGRLVQPDRALVFFTGTVGMKEEQVSRLAAKRASELSLQNGFTDYRVLNRKVLDFPETTERCVPSFYSTYGLDRLLGDYCHREVYEENVSRYTVALDVLFTRSELGAAPDRE